MANAREIKSRISSVQDTMKITNAMYMISSSKMKKAKKILSDTEPYFYNMQGAIARILRHVPDIQHPFFSVRHLIPQEERKIATIVVTGDKGMAGAYNHNITRMTEEFIASTPGYHKLYVLGMVGRQYFGKKDVDMDGSFHYTVQKPTMHRARDISAVILDQFNNHELDEVYVVYTRMENAVQSEAEVLKLLPLERGDFGEMKMPLNMYREEIELNPSPMDVMNSIVPSYINGMIYGCLVEAYASEHNARMMAMKSATDSAQDLIKDLSILYNRARQAAITQEITEVCAGARAQQKKS